MKIKYINHLGEEINLSKPPLMLEPVNAYNYSWEYEATEAQKNGIKIGGFYRSKKEVSMPMFIRGVDANGRGNLEAFNHALRLFFETVEKDIIAKIPGKLVLSNGEYITCYIVEVSHSNFAPRYRLDQREIKIVSPYPFWITEAKKQFAPVGREEIEGEFLDYTLTPRLMFNQLVRNGNFADNSKWASASITFTVANNKATCIASEYAQSYRGFANALNEPLVAGHKYFVSGRIKVVSITNSNCMVSLVLNNGVTQTSNSKNNVVAGMTYDMSSIQTLSTNGNNKNIIAYLPHSNVTAGDTFEISNVFVVDLTQMFGAGNEPSTVEEFRAMFPNDYYDYTTGRPIYIADSSSINLDYNYDYSFETPGIRTWNLDHYATSEFKMTIYGYCENPRILINGYPYQIFGTVEENEFLVIDSREKTVTHYLNNGTTENWFDFRNKENSVFEPLPSGNLTLTWDGTYGFDILAYLERSEPRWT